MIHFTLCDMVAIEYWIKRKKSRAFVIKMLNLDESEFSERDKLMFRVLFKY